MNDNYKKIERMIQVLTWIKRVVSSPHSASFNDSFVFDWQDSKTINEEEIVEIKNSANKLLRNLRLGFYVEIDITEETPNLRLKQTIIKFTIQPPEEEFKLTIPQINYIFDIGNNRLNTDSETKESLVTIGLVLVSSDYHHSMLTPKGKLFFSKLSKLNDFNRKWGIID